MFSRSAHGNTATGFYGGALNVPAVPRTSSILLQEYVSYYRTPADPTSQSTAEGIVEARLRID
jgi:hypothetical protein